MKRLLATALLLSVMLGSAPEWAQAFGPKTQLRLGVLMLPGVETERNAGLIRLSYEVRKRTSIEAAPEVAAVKPSADSLFEYPFVVLPVCNEMPALTDSHALLLRRYLDVGGLLLIDNCQGRAGGGADLWIRAATKRIYPDRELVPLAAGHSLFRTFYLLDRAYGRTSDRADLLGVDDGDRTVILVNPNDMLGALLRDAFGNPVFDLPERQREMAQRQGINIVMYALTLNYKKDQIHIPFILKRRQR